MHVYFTVDTESSMGGAWRDPARRPVDASRHIFCRIGNEAFGVPLLVKLMAQYGFRGTYFVETLATRCLGAADTRSVFDYLAGAGQDVQLHIHPTFRFYAEWREARTQGKEYAVPENDDLIGRFPEDVQMDLLGEAIRHFETFAGAPPTAFRAGCWAGSRAMLRCLKRLGIAVDSSYNPAIDPRVSFPGEPVPMNRLHKMEGVWELPATVARSRLPEGNRYRYADCTSLSFREIRVMLDASAAVGLDHFVVIFHSFSAVKARDPGYGSLRPNRIVIGRLEKMFRYLAENPHRFRVSTMGELARSAATLEAAALAHPIACLPLYPSAVRKAVQLINSPYWI